MTSPRRLRPPVVPFALWDGGMSAFSSVILTFVFATYVASGVASEGAVGEEAITAAQAHGSQVLTTWQSIGAVAVALLAPLLGNLADSGGARNALLRITTLATVATVALMPLVRLDSDYLTLGAVLIALAVVFSELAGVFVNSVLPEISTPENRGRVSGTAWAVGYWGSIVCLGVVLVLFVMPGTGMLGITGEDGWNYRAIPLFVALWILVGTLPLMLRAPRHPATAPGERWNPWQGYASIIRRVLRAVKEEPVMLQYLVASAIYRDGLGAVFSIAGVLAANAYGFGAVEIIVFGIAANLVAGVGVFLGGRVDDRVGPRDERRLRRHRQLEAQPEGEKDHQHEVEVGVDVGHHRHAVGRHRGEEAEHHRQHQEERERAAGIEQQQCGGQQRHRQALLAPVQPGRDEGPQLVQQPRHGGDQGHEEREFQRCEER